MKRVNATAFGLSRQFSGEMRVDFCAGFAKMADIFAKTTPAISDLNVIPTKERGSRELAWTHARKKKPRLRKQCATLKRK